eukprot:427799-Alexandrium_andersonii.AAC.1
MLQRRKSEDSTETEALLRSCRGDSATRGPSELSPGTGECMVIAMSVVCKEARRHAGAGLI